MAKLIAIAVIATVFGGLAGAGIYAAAFDHDSNANLNDYDERGALIHMGPLASLPEIDTTPFCVQSQHFCLVHLKTGAVRALYTYDPHPWFREQGCALPWLPDFRFTDPRTGKSSLGWFRSPCSGATFAYDGTRVFGPAPRDMDQYPVTMEKVGDSEIIVVDTTHLICGDTHSTGPPATCVKAPEPQ